jgi:hypothetical protein
VTLSTFSLKFGLNVDSVLLRLGYNNHSKSPVLDRTTVTNQEDRGPVFEITVVLTYFCILPEYCGDLSNLCLIFVCCLSSLCLLFVLLLSNFCLSFCSASV